MTRPRKQIMQEGKNNKKLDHAAELPKDAFQFSKQLGVDLAGLEPEAKAIWEQLEEMSRKDPLQYERFISEQMQVAKEEEERKKAGLPPEKSAGVTFRPNGIS